MMTKNEWPTIKSWVLYHGDIYGFNNLYVYDGSDDSRVTSFLNKSTSLGVNVIYTDANLNELRDLFNKDMKKVLNTSDLIVKMDSDELLFLWNNKTNEVIVDKQRIHSYANSMVIDGRKISIYFGLKAYVNSSTCTAEENDMITSTHFLDGGVVYGGSLKVFVPSTTFEFVDLGGHVGRVKDEFNHDNIHSDFAIAHYHFHCYPKALALNNQAMYSHGYVHVNDSKELQIEKLTNLTVDFPAVCRVASCHKAYQMLQWLKDPVTFQKQYEDGLDAELRGSPPVVYTSIHDKMIELEKKYKKWL